MVVRLAPGFQICRFRLVSLRSYTLHLPAKAGQERLPLRPHVAATRRNSSNGVCRMASKRVMMIGLDGFEPTIANPMIAAGQLPCLAKVMANGVVTSLDHGAARNTGLAWEHVATGLSPVDAGRWSAIDFEPRAYRMSQQNTKLPPFPKDLNCRTVVFDAPYFDMEQAPNVVGITNWGAHDPGVTGTANPPGLEQEIVARFGQYPAREFVYAFAWPSEQRTRRMGEALVEAMEKRTAISEWLFAEAFPHWDLAYLVAGEFHSAAEALWHGIDDQHPLHKLPSAAAARRAIEDLYLAADRMVARLFARFPDADFVLFNLHGMGANSGDVPAMALLPELIHRAQRGTACLQPGNWRLDANGFPLLDEEADWSQEVLRLMPLKRRLGLLARRTARSIGVSDRIAGTSSLDWMPITHYARDWAKMRYFAVPAYYDGQIRVNLRDREGAGLVDVADFGKVCDEVTELLAACTDPLGGGAAIREVVRTPGDPMARLPSQPDLTIHWKEHLVGLSHPLLGAIGPLPWRRTGGHTGGDGFAWFMGPGMTPAQVARRSAFDVVPTVIDMLGCGTAARVSGTSFAAEITHRSSLHAGT